MDMQMGGKNNQNKLRQREGLPLAEPIKAPKQNSCRHAILLTISDSIKGNLISIITR